MHLTTQECEYDCILHFENLWCQSLFIIFCKSVFSIKSNGLSWSNIIGSFIFLWIHCSQSMVLSWYGFMAEGIHLARASGLPSSRSPYSPSHQKSSWSPLTTASEYWGSLQQVGQCNFLLRPLWLMLRKRGNYNFWRKFGFLYGLLVKMFVNN